MTRLRDLYLYALNGRRLWRIRRDILPETRDREADLWYRSFLSFWDVSFNTANEICEVSGPSYSNATYNVLEPLSSVRSGPLDERSGGFRKLVWSLLRMFPANISGLP